MNNAQGLQPLNQSLSGLPQWVSERILQQINQLTHYEPVIGIMGKSGAGKSSLCNALFASEVSPVSDVAACTREPLRFRLQVGDRYMTLVEVVKRALHFNAAAVILAHNHPSGETTPSQADKALTQRLVQVLQMVDIRVPDHLIVGGRQIFSFAEHGLL